MRSDLHSRRATGAKVKHTGGLVCAGTDNFGSVLDNHQR